jgi:hypothetical protein
LPVEAKVASFVANIAPISEGIVLVDISTHSLHLSLLGSKPYCDLFVSLAIIQNFEGDDPQSKWSFIA